MVPLCLLRTVVAIQKRLFSTHFLSVQKYKEKFNYPYNLFKVFFSPL